MDKREVESDVGGRDSSKARHHRAESHRCLSVIRKVSHLTLDLAVLLPDVSRIYFCSVDVDD